MSKNKEYQQISDAEYEIMKIIWQYKRIKASDIIQNVDKDFNWNDRTIKTMLNRLLKKNVISYDKDGKSYIYYSLVNEEDYKSIESKTFIKKVFDGSLISMFSSFLKESDLSKKEIDDLKKLLEEKEDN